MIYEHILLKFLDEPELIFAYSQIISVISIEYKCS